MKLSENDHNTLVAEYSKACHNANIEDSHLYSITKQLPKNDDERLGITAGPLPPTQLSNMEQTQIDSQPYRNTTSSDFQNFTSPDHAAEQITNI